MISKALFIACSLIVIPMHAEIIPATKTDANTVYYIVNSSNALEAGYIFCDQAAPICHVECNGEYSCHHYTINATSSQHLNLECNDQLSCKSITVYGAINSTHVNCGGISGENNTYACSSMKLDVSRSSSVDVRCNTRYACHNSTVDGSFVRDAVNVNCEAANSCYNLFILCPNQDNSCNLNCKDSGSGSSDSSCNKAWVKLDWQSLSERQQNVIDSPILNLSCALNTSDCAGITFDCDHYDSYIGGAEKTQYQWDSVTQKYKCSNLICCPIYAGNTVLCEAGKDCHIDCDDHHCAQYIINAQDATSLTVGCGSGCQGNYFQCPLSSNSACNVVCNGSCARAVFYGNAATDINIECRGSFACYYVKMYITSANNAVNLSCMDGSCWYIGFTNYGDNSISNIECEQCMMADFRFNSSNAISIKCVNEENACVGSSFSGGYGGDVSVECSALKSCYYVSLSMKHVDSLTVRASANDTFGSGVRSLYPPAQIENGTQIICEFERACTNLEIYYGQYSVSGWLDAQCNSPTNACSDIMVTCAVVSNTGTRETAKTILSSNASIGEYFCNTTAESMQCCPFAVVNPSISGNPSASPTLYPTKIQNTQAAELVSTILTLKSSDHGQEPNDVYTLSITNPALFVVLLLQIIF